MWFELLLDNWKEAVVGGLTGYIVIKDLINRLPNFSLKKKLEKSTSMQISSANVVFSKVEQMLGKVESLTKVVEMAKIEYDKNIEIKDKENAYLKGVISLILVKANVPLSEKEAWYNGIKKVEGIGQEVINALGAHIESEKSQTQVKVEYDTTLDQELDKVV